MKNSNDLVQEIIDKSGNKFHSDFVALLRGMGWTVQISPFYTDSLTDKPREIDIVAEKEFDVNDYYFPQNPVGHIAVRLIIECKYIPKNTVFWFDKKDMERAEKRIRALFPFEEGLSLKHRYLKNENVAKLFSSTSDKQYENEPFFKALSQCLNAFIAFGHDEHIISQKNLNRLGTISYPLVLCKSFKNFYKVEMGQSNYKEIQDNFQFEVNYAYLDSNKRSVNEYFLIDVVNYEDFDEYIKEIENFDAKMMTEGISLQIQKRERPNSRQKRLMN